MANDEATKDYIKQLSELESFLRGSYDKLVITIATGSIGLSVLFVIGIIDSGKPIQSSDFLLFGWICLLLTVVSILMEIFFGIKAHRKAIEQTYAKDMKKLGGWFSGFARFFHNVSPVFLIVGLGLVLCFVYANIVTNERQEISNTTTVSASEGSCAEANPSHSSG